MTKDCPGGYCLALNIKSSVSRDSTITDIGYKYNMCKVISFIVTEYSGITKADIAYLSKFPDMFDNFSI